MTGEPQKTWYLRRRITWAFGLSAFLLSVALSLLYGWTVWMTIQEEIDALAREELEATQAHFAETEPTPATFADVAREMSSEHDDDTLAWRVWNVRTGALWGEFGSAALLASVPHRSTESDFRPDESSRRWLVAPLGNELIFGVMLDATAQAARFDRIALAGILLVLVSTAMAAVVGGLLAGRVSSLLARVAQSARTEDSVETWLAPSEAPAETQEVVHALQDTLRRIRAEAENAQLVISGMAHELRSPLQNLMGETQVTLLRERDPTEYRRVLESQLEELSELSRVVDNLVTLCSADEARRRRGTESFDLGKDARLRLAREFQLARRHEVVLELHAEGPLLVEGDRESLLLALRNVVTNAIEWSPAGRSVEVRLRASAGVLEILVDDAGPGVPLAERTTLFEPFHRRPAAEGRRVGFGLGLALTRSAVESHGGHIEVGDSPLGGARFAIRLPQRWRGVAGADPRAEAAG